MLPEEFLSRMRSYLEGDEYEAFLSSYDDAPKKSLRINRLKRSSGAKTPEETLSKILKDRVEWCDNGYYVNADDRPGRNAYHEAGLYYIQEASAMAPVKWLDVRPGMKVLDLCAAPGGKSTEIACDMENTGLLVSNEPEPDRARILSLNIERSSIYNALVTSEMPDRLSAGFEGYFDRILVDAPCSGEGMFRKNPEAVNEWSPGSVIYCAKRQAGILKEAAKMLVPGGMMVYSTCTFSRDENEDTIEKFLKENKDYSPVDPGAVRKLPEGFVKSGYGVRIYPHRVKGEGHFFCVLKREGSVPVEIKRLSSKGFICKTPDSDVKLFKDFVRESLPDLNLPEGIIHSFGDQLYLAPKDCPGLSGLKVLRPGLHLGTLKKGRFEPSHALALFVSPDEAALNACINGSPDMALKFMKGETLPAGIISGGDIKGWCIVSVDGYSLGWGKSDGRIIKNHYPRGLRI